MGRGKGDAKLNDRYQILSREETITSRHRGSRGKLYYKSVLKISPSTRVEDTLDNGINQENDEQIRAVYLEETNESSFILHCSSLSGQ